MKYQRTERVIADCKKSIDMTTDYSVWVSKHLAIPRDCASPSAYTAGKAITKHRGLYV